MENWQTPGCAQRDCDFTSHSISNILLLWIKSSQSKSASACACLFGKEMLFRGILFLVVMEQDESEQAEYWCGALSMWRFLASAGFSFWLNYRFLLRQGTSYILYIRVSMMITCAGNLYGYCMYSVCELMYIIAEALRVSELVSVYTRKFFWFRRPLLYPRG